MTADTQKLINALAPKLCGRCTKRPYNYHHPASTTWWLVDSTEWPAYHLPKYSVENRDRETYAGINIEKGHGNVVLEHDDSTKVKNQIMQDHWFWYKWIEMLTGESERIESKLSAIASETDIKFSCIVGVGPFNPHREDLQSRELLRSSTVYFSVNDDGSLTWRDNDLNESDQEVAQTLESFREISGFKELAVKLDDFSKSEWLWIDVYLALHSESVDLLKSEHRNIKKVGSLVGL